MSATVAAADVPTAAHVSLIPAVNAELRAFLDTHARLLSNVHPDLAMISDAAREAVLAGGKRLRPTFAYWGWRSVTPIGGEGETEFLRAAASLEMLHACALVHDDVMDASSIRRGRPAAHVTFVNIHQEEQWPGSAGVFGASAAILLGDLLLSWAGEMFTGAISQLSKGRASSAKTQFDLMSTEVVAGQFLDVLAQTRGAFDIAEATRVMEYKTSKYTVQRPLLLGAGAAGAPLETLGALRAYGLSLGEAFQLRDDLLGVFGDPSETGKPAGDDLREGKRTLLVALAMEQADSIQQRVLREGIGKADLSADAVEELRDVLIHTGAVRAVEDRITLGLNAAVKAISEAALQLAARTALVELASAAAHRKF
jgi:geranylgeranyl diphosphate synthase type I